jgi:small subunit ribosomal protein S6e
MGVTPKDGCKLSECTPYHPSPPPFSPLLTLTPPPPPSPPPPPPQIRKLFALSKDDDVRRYVNTYRRTFTDKKGKTHSKAPKIQRLVTPVSLQRKRRRAAIKKGRVERVRTEQAEYHKVLVQRIKEQRERRSESLAKKRATRMASLASKE